MHRKALNLIAITMLSANLGSAENPNHPAVSLKHDAGAATVEVHIRGEHFTTYRYGDAHHVPFLWPVMSEGGVGVTRNHPMGEDDPAVTDHPHHLSLYLTYGALNEFDFWHAGRGKPGVIKTTRVETGDAGGFAWLRTHNHWIARKDDQIVMEETREIRFHDGPPSARYFDFITTFHATHGDITFGDTKEGMLAVRMRPELDGERGGLLTNAHGEQGEKNVYGKPSPWMDYTGAAKGHGKRGIAIFDHPANPHSAHWHVRDYGLAALNPFGARSIANLPDGRHTLKNGDSFTLRYRVLVHSGSHEEAGVATHFTRYAADPDVLKSTNPAKP
jgi:hypothetical protein